MDLFKVLIVEDESITALQLKKKILSWGFDVVGIAAYGEEAIEKALETNPDIILMDVILKGDMDGIGAAERIKDNLTIPIIYLTAFTDKATMERAKFTEPANYILKPFDDNELRFALEMSEYKRKVREKLEKTQKYLDLITNHMGDSVGQVDEKGSFLYISPSVKKILGFGPEQMVGKTIFEFIHPDDMERSIKLFKSAIKESKPLKIRNRLQNIHDEYIWIETVGIPIYDAENKLEGAVFSSRDIEDQVKVENELKSALNYSRNLIEASLDPMVTISQNGEIMDVNKAFEDAIGLCRKDLIGTDFSQYFTDSEKAMRGYQKTLFYGSLKDYSLTLRHTSGRTMDVSFNATVYRSSEGEVEGVFAAARNITKLKNANNALKLSERHFRSLIENALDVILVLNEDGDVTYASPSVESVFGYKIHEFLGFNIFDFIHPHDAKILSQILDSKLKYSRSSHDFEIRSQHEDGSWIICQMVAQNLLQDPAVGGYVLNVRDITPRKVAERARNDLEKMYSTLIKASPDGIIATDLDGNITHMSEKAISMLGWEEQSNFSKKAVFDVIDLDEYDSFLKNMKIVKEQGALHNIEHKLYDKEGSAFIAEMNIVLSNDSKGIPKGYIATLRDITYRKKMENQIKSSLKEKEILLKELHHRVKNNMQIISSLIGLQSEQVDDRKTRAMFEDSKNRIKSMAIIHENLYTSDIEEVNFSQYVESLVQTLEKSYNSKKRNIGVDIDVDNVVNDMDQSITCGLILNELISNCFKYAFPYQDENHKKPKIMIKAYNNGKNTIINVKDNGIGVPADLDFKKTDSLGLQIVCTLVAQLGGTIDLDNSQGTNFCIEFNENGHY
ncbi:PAS domain S-box protein [Methanobacterium alcaliphilum]|uniref:PAS domain S-box protein n=1 Tax=Methanobacterium alcaliphilum TaxID=392018 RepID=UPI00200B2878|nr:PAS domain S-box protein [Methanobacterium alcaliphilum]MCK9151500.1 PAS domain S-box protein [Methanobacterium alcaliphilum]